MKPLQKTVAWASSSAYRKNQLMSAAQYQSCAEKNRVEFDIPLVTRSAFDAAQAEIDRLSHELYDACIAQTELGGALCDVISLLPDPHLDPDKVQAHFVRKAKEVLEAFSEKRRDHPKTLPE